MNTHQGNRCIIAKFDHDVAIGIKMHVVLDLIEVVIVPFRQINDVFARREVRHDVMAIRFANLEFIPARATGQRVIPGTAIKMIITRPTKQDVIAGIAPPSNTSLDWL